MVLTEPTISKNIKLPGTFASSAQTPTINFALLSAETSLSGILVRRTIRGTGLWTRRSSTGAWIGAGQLWRRRHLLLGGGGVQD